MITLPCLIVEGSQILHFGGKNPQVDLIVIREWPRDLKYPHNFKKFWYFPPGSFCSTPLQLDTPYIVGLAGLVPLRHRAFVGISWVPIFFSWVFRRSQIFSCGYFVGPKVFLVGISWVQSFFSWVFRGSKISSHVENFVNFSCRPPEKKWHRNMSQTLHSIPKRFQQVWILLILERYFVYIYAITQF